MSKALKSRTLPRMHPYILRPTFAVAMVAAMAACPAATPPSASDAADDGSADAPTDTTSDVSTDTAPPLQPVAALPGTQIRHDFTRAGGFYSAPFPSEDLRTPAGGVALPGFPNPSGTDMVAALLDVIARDVRGFSLTAPIFLQLDGPLSEASGALPDITASVTAASPIFLADVDPASPSYGKRYPIDTDYHADGGPFGAEHLLAALPLQGVSLRPETRHALVVTRALTDASGAPLGRSDNLANLLSGKPVAGLNEDSLAHYLDAIRALGSTGLANSEDIVGLAVFVTDDPTAQFRAFREHLLARPLPVVTDLAPKEVFDDFCVYEAVFDAPTYQHGTPPFSTPSDGGTWKLTAAGTPLPAGTEQARIVFTIPRTPMPTTGYPVAVMVRTGGGGDRPLVDRGPRAENGGTAISPGTGPARHFAQAGFAGVSPDGPHGGLRNVTGADEQFLMFNVANIAAMRDNVRQTALELALLPGLLKELVIDASACPGADPAARLDTSSMALMGHSMGATVAPLALASEPAYGAAILSGAGGSWIENVIFKQKPLNVRPLAAALLGYGPDYELHRFDPALALLQWAGEPADPPVYGRYVVDEPSIVPGAQPRHVLMLQGIVDRYILPPIANATTLSLGLQLAGEALDEQVPEIAEMRSIQSVMPFVDGLGATPYPVSGNRRGATVMVSQHAEDGIEDGHEVAFQLPGPKVQYRCFLETWKAAGTPKVPAPDHAGACP